MSVRIVDHVPGRGDIRVVLKVRPGSYNRGDLVFLFPDGASIEVELAPRHVRLLLALVLAYHEAARPGAPDEAYAYRGQVHPTKLGRLYARVNRHGAPLEAKSVRTYVSELKKLVAAALEARGVAALVEPEVIAGGDGYRIGAHGLEVLRYDVEAKTPDASMDPTSEPNVDRAADTLM